MRRVSAAFTQTERAAEVIDHLHQKPGVHMRVQRLMLTDARLKQQDVGHGILYGLLLGTATGLALGLLVALTFGGSLGTILLISVILGMLNGVLLGSLLEASTKRALAEVYDRLRHHGAILIDVQPEDAIVETEVYQQFTRNQGVILSGD